MRTGVWSQMRGRYPRVKLWSLYTRTAGTGSIHPPDVHPYWRAGSLAAGRCRTILLQSRSLRPHHMLGKLLADTPPHLHPTTPLKVRLSFAPTRRVEAAELFKSWDTKPRFLTPSAGLPHCTAQGRERLAPRPVLSLPPLPLSPTPCKDGDCQNSW